MPLPSLFGASSIFKSSIAWFAVNVLDKFVYRIMFILGIGLVTYVGGGNITDLITGEISTNLSNIPEHVRAILGRARIHECLSIIITAYIYRLTYVSTRTFIGVRK